MSDRIFFGPVVCLFVDRIGSVDLASFVFFLRGFRPDGRCQRKGDGKAFTIRVDINRRPVGQLEIGLRCADSVHVTNEGPHLAMHLPVVDPDTDPASVIAGNETAVLPDQNQFVRRIDIDGAAGHHGS